MNELYQVRAAIYRLTDGKILMRVRGTPETIPEDVAVVAESAGVDCDFYLNCPEEATHIIDFEPVVVGPTLEDLKVEKDRDIAAAFNRQLVSGTPTGFLTSLGWAVYDAVEDLSNYERALNSLRLTGAQSKVIKIKSDPIFVTATLAELELVVKELTIHGEDMYARKWQLQAFAAAAETVENLEAISW